MRYNELLGGQSIILLEAKIKNTFHCAKHNQHTKTWGSGGLPPRKILKNRCSEIKSEGILEHAI